MTRHVEAVKQSLGFRHPIIGIHIRHGDSCSDPRPYTMRRCWPLAEYMAHARRFKERYGVRTVFLATDDAEVAEAAQQEFREFDFLIQRLNRTNHDSLEFVDDQLRAGTLDPGREGRDVVTDISLLASSDFFIGTFSGNIGRIAYQLSSAWKGFQPPIASLDIPWCSHWGHTWPVNGMPMAC